jgi:hypothetical protein
LFHTVTVFPPRSAIIMINRENERDGEKSIFDIIRESCFNGDLQKIEMLLSEDKSLCNVQDKRGNTPLVYACMGDKMSVVNYLIESGGSVHIKNSCGLSALMYTKGLFRRAQILRKWELCTAKGRATSAAVEEEFLLMNHLKRQSHKEAGRSADIQKIFYQQTNIGVALRLTREVTYKTVAWVQMKGSEAVAVAVVGISRKFQLKGNMFRKPTVYACA